MTKKPQVTVRMFTSLRALTGVRETQLEAEDVQEVIDILGNKFGDKFKKMVLEPDGSLKSYFHVSRMALMVSASCLPLSSMIVRSMMVPWTIISAPAAAVAAACSGV